MINDELMHYGIKGMKWGVRRTPEQLGRVSRARYRKARTIKKGTKMYRATVNPNEETIGSKYVTYLDVDRDNYKAFDAGGDFILRKAKGYNNLYENKYSLTKDMKVASRKEVINTFQKLAEDKDTVRRIGKAWIESTVLYPTDEEFLDKSSDYNHPEKHPEFEKYLQKARDTALNDYLIDREKTKSKYTDQRFFEDAWAVNVSDDFKKQVISDLKKKGFDAMTDEGGVGGKGGDQAEGMDPLIIFESEKFLKKEKTVFSDNDIRDDATRRYNAWFRETNYDKKKTAEKRKLGERRKKLPYRIIRRGKPDNINYNYPEYKDLGWNW